jgi:hypothetical protein
VLPVVSPNPAELPTRLSPQQAVEYAHELTYRQAQPILQELGRLQAAEEIEGFEVAPELHGVTIRGASRRTLAEISRLQEISALLPLGEEAPTCAVAAAEALPEQILSLSQVTARSQTALQPADLRAQATDPSIMIEISLDSGWANVSGSAAPDSTVTLRILRGGRTLATESTTSSSSGYYSFRPSWHACPSSGYDWSLRPGDVVEVTAGGNTVSTVVAHLSAWVDPETDVVAGSTDPGRSVEVQLLESGGDPCRVSGHSQTLNISSDGTFSTDFTGRVDFDRRAYALVYAEDSNGNSTYSAFSAYHIASDFGSTGFLRGYLPPEVDFSATLSRTGGVVATYNGSSNASGSYYGSFTQTIQAGDVISVSGGGVEMQYTATDLEITWDHAADQISGAVTPGRLVRTGFHPNSGGWTVSTSCVWDYDCNSGVADGSGAFLITTTLDLKRGDYAYIYVYDAEGHYQYQRRYLPVVVAELSWNHVTGHWSHYRTGGVTVTLKESGGVVKERHTGVGLSSWNYEFDAGMTSSIAPTDIIEVTDGTSTETMTVQNLSARLNSATGHLTGTAINGDLLARLYDFRRESDYSYSYCCETQVTEGSYDLTFDSADLGGQDEARVWSTGPNGHYTHRDARAFSINAQKDSNDIWGYSETPHTPITITLQSGGSSQVTRTTTSDALGYYEAYLWDDGIPITITQGDVVQVETGAGRSADLAIPLLTVHADAADNRLYGQAPASQPVRLRVRRHYLWGYYLASQNTQTDGSGDYSASFDDRYWSRDCSSIDVGHGCSQPVVYYYNSDGHQVWLEGAYPEPVEPDSYESDNSSSTATPYSGVQSHTFHVVTDTDWISFTVPQADVDNNVVYRISTFNLGWGMSTQVQLYNAGMDALATWWGNENHGRGVSALWTPSAAGDYYLEVATSSSSHAAYCDAVYDLRVLPVRARVYLPLVMQSY